MTQNWPFLNQPAIQKLICALNYKNHQFFFVGGCIRDSILELPFSDFDIASNLQAELNFENLKTQGIKVIPTGLSYGTITAIIDNIEFQITTFRNDVETFGRKAIVKQTNSLFEDAKRRDFTFNALYLNPLSLEFFDYFNGIENLYNGEIKFIGEPKNRINEDFLRILRYFRFYGKYGKQEPSDYIKKLLFENRYKLTLLSKERISNELTKIFTLKTNCLSKALLLMSETKILNAFCILKLQSLEHEALNNLYETISMAKIKNKNIINVLILGFIIEEKSISLENSHKLLLRKKDFSLLTKILNLKALLIKYEILEFADICKLTAEYGFEVIISSLILIASELQNQKYHIFNVINKLTENSAKEFPINGDDIKNLDIKNQKNIGYVIKKLKEFYWMGTLTSKKKYITKAQSIIDNNKL